jgi:hypothetical protein
MKLLLGLILWMVIGYVAFTIAYVNHMLKAENDGYRAEEYWDNLYVQETRNDDTSDKVFKLILGLLVWPCTIMKFNELCDEYQKYYEPK